MEPVTTDPKGEARGLSGNTSALATQKRSMEITEAYVTGFIDGEGSFLVSFNRRPTLATGLEVRPSFSVSQHERNLEVLQKILASGEGLEKILTIAYSMNNFGARRLELPDLLQVVRKMKV